MAPPRQQGQTSPGVIAIFGFGQNAPAKRHDRIGCENAFSRPVGGDGLRLLAREPARKIARQFVPAGRFVDFGGQDFARDDADLGQQVPPAGRGRSQHELGGRGAPVRRGRLRRGIT